MESILERYERYSYAEKQLIGIDSVPPQESWSLEYPKLIAKIEVLNRNIRHYVGEDLDPLSMRELQSLELQLDNALKRIRTRKNQLMHETISEHQKKEKTLQQQNSLLEKKLKEIEKNRAERQEQETLGQNSTTFMLPPPPPPPPPFPQLTSLSIGGTFQGREGLSRENGVQAGPPCSNSAIPPWMLSLVNQ
ncbi:unnamed protein product [Ilex paraguariensis]|uniref:K-box domain-containing protein n=1 Tax=Ilex paraguariensis TaxID=185542 RepID=A0ABC8U3A3_9AQUA